MTDFNGTWQDFSDNLSDADLLTDKGLLNETNVTELGFLRSGNLTDFNGTWEDNSDNLSDADLLTDKGLLNESNVTNLGFLTMVNMSVLNGTWSGSGGGIENNTEANLSNVVSDSWANVTLTTDQITNYTDEGATLQEIADNGFLNSTNMSVFNGTWEDNSDNLTADDIIALGFINDSNTTLWDKDSTDDATLQDVADNGFLNGSNMTDFNGTWEDNSDNLSDA